jgi:hypothetical protein
VRPGANPLIFGIIGYFPERHFWQLRGRRGAAGSI